MFHPPSLSRTPIGRPAEATVFTTVLTRGPVSRVDIARMTGLSQAAVTKAARPFIDAGYIEELPNRDRVVTGAGRPASPLAVRAEREFFVGIKITADELIGVVTDLRARILHARHVPLASHEFDRVVTQIADLAGELLDQDDAYRERTHCLGVALSGDVDRASGKVRYSPFIGWNDVELAARLTGASGLITTLENDVKALTVAEQWFGEGVDTSSFALVTVGAGIGCGLVVNGRVVSGAYGVAGEIGHVPVADDGPPCHCGGRGCVEAIASTEAIVAASRVAAGWDLTMDDAVALARSGHEGVRQVFSRAGHAIGLGLAAMVNLVGPERVVVSGEGVANYDLFEEQIRQTFAVQAFAAASGCPLTIRPLPFEEWARGAAAVAIQTLFTL
jgi:predicted NBD/HSP70 family sugar kinase